MQNSGKSMIPHDKLLCYYCFERLQNSIRKDNQNIISDSMLKYQKFQFPLFVEFLVDNELRGKVGCYSNIGLVNGLSEYSIAAGMKDFRYSPLSKNELQKSICIVTLLHDFEPITDLQKWKADSQGILIKYHGSTVSVFPSEIKSESSNEEIFKYLTKKIGSSTSIQFESVEMKTFQTTSISANWSEYQEYITSHV